MSKAHPRQPGRPSAILYVPTTPEEDREASERARRAALTRRAHTEAGRPRFVDPTTTEMQYSAEEVEFLMAVDAYRRRTGRQFPTLRELLTILRGLGWSRSCPEPTPTP